MRQADHAYQPMHGFTQVLEVYTEETYNTTYGMEGDNTEGRAEVDYSVIFLLHVHTYIEATQPLYTRQATARMSLIKFQDYSCSRKRIWNTIKENFHANV